MAVQFLVVLLRERLVPGVPRRARLREVLRRCHYKGVLSRALPQAYGPTALSHTLMAFNYSRSAAESGEICVSTKLSRGWILSPWAHRVAHAGRHVGVLPPLRLLHSSSSCRGLFVLVLMSAALWFASASPWSTRPCSASEQRMVPKCFQTPETVHPLAAFAALFEHLDDVAQSCGWSPVQLVEPRGRQ